MDTKYLSRTPSKLQRIPEELLDAYKRRKITSAVLSQKTGMNASYLRRAIVRDPPQPRPNKGALIAARRAYRMSIADKSAAEIANLAHVSLRTAQRIKEQARKLAPVAQPAEGTSSDEHP